MKLKIIKFLDYEGEYIVAKPVDLTGKRVGKLLVKNPVPKKLRPSQSHGVYWYCDCDCGNKNIMVPASYLTGNGNYTQTSCGCDRKMAAFIKSSGRQGLTIDYLTETFPNFEKFLLIHKAFVRTTNIDVIQMPLQKYKYMIEYFYNNKQFNAVYNFWKNHNDQKQTFYDWAKPSIDHIVPKSKGGTDDLSNLQFLTVFENLTKRDMSMEEWNNFKFRTHTTSDYFIENIMRD